MNVVIAIYHYPHINFFKNAIRELQRKGIEINLVVRPRGNLTAILDHEIGINYFVFGRYQSTFINKAIDASLNEFRIYNYLSKTPYNVATGIGSIELAHSSFILQKPSVIFTDDVELKLAYYPYKYFAKRIVVPQCTPVKGKRILKYKGFKELAYLHPHRFSPRQTVLQEYGLESGNYIFIREVSNTSTNYYGLTEGYLTNLCPDLKRMGFGIVLSLENKVLKKQFEEYCIILEEPVSDIHSLMHYAAMTIASGDSMARESCLLGTPAIYTGGRKMSINAELERKGCLIPCVPEKQQILDTVSKILNGNLKKQTKKVIDQAIESEWEDTTEVIVNTLLAEIYKDESLISKYKRDN